MPQITAVKAREVLDSRGNPTIEVDVYVNDRFAGRGIAPSGASTGSREALELRDGDSHRFHGKGVLKAVDLVRSRINNDLVGRDCTNLHEIDQILIENDGSSIKENYGANTLTAISIAVARAGAYEKNIPLYQHLAEATFSEIPEKYIIPVPMCNVINGGKHGGSSVEFQEFMIEPIGASSFFEGIRQVSEVYHTLKEILVKKWGPSMKNVGDEGGFSGPIPTVKDILDSLVSAVENTGYQCGQDFAFTLDPAATEFFNGKTYTVEGRQLSSEELLDFYTSLVNNYPIRSLEDPFAEDDWSGFQKITKRLGSKVQIVGDDLLVTNKKYIEKAIEEQSVNSVLLKINQIGTVSEVIEAVKLSKENALGTVISHRSGETEDTFIADLAVGTGAGQIKTGAPARSDRTAKYNQLIRIEEELKGRTLYGITTL